MAFTGGDCCYGACRDGRLTHEVIQHLPGCRLGGRTVHGVVELDSAVLQAGVRHDQYRHCPAAAGRVKVSEADMWAHDLLLRLLRQLVSL